MGIKSHLFSAENAPSLYFFLLKFQESSLSMFICLFHNTVTAQLKFSIICLSRTKKVKRITWIYCPRIRVRQEPFDSFHSFTGELCSSTAELNQPSLADTSQFGQLTQLITRAVILSARI